MATQNEFIAPVNHTALSGFSSTAAGTAGGAVKGGVKGALVGLGLFAAAGLAVGLFVASGGVGMLLTAAGAATASAGGAGGLFAGAFSVAKFIGITGLFTAGGVALGSAFGVPLGSMAGGLVGGVKGHARASERVSQERGQAAVLDAQIEMIRAQSAPSVQTHVYAQPGHDNKFNFPAQGSSMNAASPQLDASSVAYDQRIAGAQLARA